MHFYKCPHNIKDTLYKNALIKNLVISFVSYGAFEPSRFFVLKSRFLKICMIFQLKLKLTTVQYSTVLQLFVILTIIIMSPFL